MNPGFALAVFLVLRDTIMVLNPIGCNPCELCGCRILPGNASGFEWRLRILVIAVGQAVGEAETCVQCYPMLSLNQLWLHGTSLNLKIWTAGLLVVGGNQPIGDIGIHASGSWPAGPCPGESGCRVQPAYNMLQPVLGAENLTLRSRCAAVQHYLKKAPVQRWWSAATAPRALQSYIMKSKAPPFDCKNLAEDIYIDELGLQLRESCHFHCFLLFLLLICNHSCLPYVLTSSAISIVRWMNISRSRYCLCSVQ